MTDLREDGALVDVEIKHKALGTHVFDLETIRHYRMPTCEEESAAVVIRNLRTEISSLRAQLEIKWAMRKEVEELLGFGDGDTYGEEAFCQALERLRKMAGKQKVA